MSFDGWLESAFECADTLGLRGDCQYLCLIDLPHGILHEQDDSLTVSRDRIDPGSYCDQVRASDLLAPAKENFLTLAILINHGVATDLSAEVSNHRIAVRHSHIPQNEETFRGGFDRNADFGAH